MTRVPPYGEVDNTVVIKPKNDVEQSGNRMEEIKRFDFDILCNVFASQKPYHNRFVNKL